MMNETFMYIVSVAERIEMFSESEKNVVNFQGIFSETTAFQDKNEVTYKPGILMDS